ncbi:hypothetical protein BDR26DRAFT_981244 [Obelidium mucronatum]|nr:hypothetical protein BDR26DRAFT_981244 [Obelidium mucronatum]
MTNSQKRRRRQPIDSDKLELYSDAVLPLIKNTRQKADYKEIRDLLKTHFGLNSNRQDEYSKPIAMRYQRNYGERIAEGEREKARAQKLEFINQTERLVAIGWALIYDEDQVIMQAHAKVNLLSVTTSEAKYWRIRVESKLNSPEQAREWTIDQCKANMVLWKEGPYIVSELVLPRNRTMGMAFENEAYGEVFGSLLDHCLSRFLSDNQILKDGRALFGSPVSGPQNLETKLENIVGDSPQESNSPVPLLQISTSDTTESTPNKLTTTIQQLSEAAELEVDQAFGKGPLVLVSGFNIDLKRYDIQTLLPGKWLNDEIINFYGSMLIERRRDTLALEDGPNG